MTSRSRFLLVLAMSFIRTNPTAEALIDVGAAGDIPIVINGGPGAVKHPHLLHVLIPWSQNFW